MIPIGYMAKRVLSKPASFGTSQVNDFYSLSGCLSGFFADYVPFWKHNGYWLFDSVELIQEVAREAECDLTGTSMFYYEAYEFEFDDVNWNPIAPEPAFTTNVAPPVERQLEGFDVVTFSNGAGPECSPLSCNGLANEAETNRHCLLPTFEQAKQLLESGVFVDSEPGPYRIVAVYSTNLR
jgi:hypothetical protein